MKINGVERQVLQVEFDDQLLKIVDTCSSSKNLGQLNVNHSLIVDLLEGLITRCELVKEQSSV